MSEEALLFIQRAAAQTTASDAASRCAAARYDANVRWYVPGYGNRRKIRQQRRGEGTETACYAAYAASPATPVRNGDGSVGSCAMLLRLKDRRARVAVTHRAVNVGRYSQTTLPYSARRRSRAPRRRCCRQYVLFAACAQQCSVARAVARAARMR
jgi:hypothetical protein